MNNQPCSGERSDSFDEHSDEEYSGSEDIIEIKNASHFDSSSSDSSHHIVIATSVKSNEKKAPIFKKLSRSGT
jgi:hypothetical protein